MDASADLPPELRRVRVCLRGIEAPGTVEGGAAARAFLRGIVFGGPAPRRIEVVGPRWARVPGCNGRVVADVVVDGRLLSRALVAAGHGRRGDGRTTDCGAFAPRF